MNRTIIVLSIISILVFSALASYAGDGTMPSNNELSCSIRLSKKVYRVGDLLVVNVKVRNVSDKVVHFHFSDIYQARHLQLTNEKGEVLKGYMTAVYGPATSSNVYTLNPGEEFNAGIKGRFEYITDDKGTQLILNCRDYTFELGTADKFSVAFDYKFDPSIQKYAKKPLWNGKLSCGPVTFSVRSMNRLELNNAIKMLRTGNIDQKMEAAEVVRANLDKEAVSVLMKLLTNENILLAQAVSNALCSIHDESILPEIEQLLMSTGSGDTQRMTLDIIGCFKGYNSPYTIQLLIKTLKSGVSYESRRYAANSLGLYRAYGAIPDLIEVAKDENPIVQRAAIDALGALGETLPADQKNKVTGPLVDIMKTADDATVRSRAASALGQAGDKSAVPDLLNALDDPDKWVGSYAASSLGRLANADAIPALKKYAETAEKQSQTDAANKAIDEITWRADMKKNPDADR